MLKFKYLVERSLIIGEKDITGSMWVNPEQIARINIEDGKDTAEVKFRNSETFKVLDITEADVDELARRIWARGLSEVE
jgi:hypothetical protein